MDGVAFSDRANRRREGEIRDRDRHGGRRRRRRCAEQGDHDGKRERGNLERGGHGPQDSSVHWLQYERRRQPVSVLQPQNRRTTS